MKKFKFTFQTLLNITVSLEKEQKNNLAIVNNQLNALEKIKEGILKDTKNARENYANVCTINEFINGNHYLSFLKKNLVDINVRISMKENERNNLQDQLIETMTQRKTYENLQKKQWEVYKKELAIEDDKALGDFIANNGGE
jgi:Flagellar biosynthesis chaperone